MVGVEDVSVVAAVAFAEDRPLDTWSIGRAKRLLTIGVMEPAGACRNLLAERRPSPRWVNCIQMSLASYKTPEGLVKP